ncbi:MAG: NYN domain-containing protein [Flavobacteriales bacterium]
MDEPIAHEPDTSEPVSASIQGNTSDNTPPQAELRLALLIDAENVSAKDVQAVMRGAATHGRTTIRNIYGDFTNTHMKNWGKVLRAHALCPVQQYQNSQGKNSSDSALIIDAMDILHTGKVDGFVIVSNDGDFTRLAVRLRKSDKRVFGIGEERAADALVMACDVYTYLHLLRSPQPKSRKKGVPPPPRDRINDPALVQLVHNTIDDLNKNTEWVKIHELRDGMVKRSPGFNQATYGKRKFVDLLSALDDLMLKTEGTGDKLVYLVRRRVGVKARN